jgi:hypothetical protein
MHTSIFLTVTPEDSDNFRMYVYQMEEVPFPSLLNLGDAAASIDKHLN